MSDCYYDECRCDYNRDCEACLTVERESAIAWIVYHNVLTSAETITEET